MRVTRANQSSEKPEVGLETELVGTEEASSASTRPGRREENKTRQEIERVERAESMAVYFYKYSELQAKNPG
jgi:hypothetical protein